MSGSDWFLPFPTSNVWFLLVWPQNTRHGQTKPVKKSVVVRGGRVKWVSGFIHSHNNTLTQCVQKLWIIQKKKLIGYCKPTNFCGRGDRIWTCDLLVPKPGTCVRRSPVISCFPALKPDKTGEYRTNLGCFSGCRLYNEALQESYWSRFSDDSR